MQNIINFEDYNNQRKRESSRRDASNDYYSQRPSRHTQENLSGRFSRNSRNYKAPKGTKKKLAYKAAAIALASVVSVAGIGTIAHNISNDTTNNTKIEQESSQNYTGVSNESIESFEALKADIDNYYTSDTALNSVDENHTYIADGLNDVSLDVIHEKIANAYGVEADTVKINIAGTDNYIISYTDEQGQSQSIEISTKSGTWPKYLSASLNALNHLQSHLDNTSGLIKQHLKNSADTLDNLMQSDLVVDKDGNLLEYSIHKEDLSKGEER